MKTKTISSVLVLLSILFAGCEKAGTAWQQGTSTVEISGRPGSQATISYAKNGRPRTMTNVIPFTVSNTGLANVVVAKLATNEILHVSVRYHDDERGASFANATANPGIKGVKIEFRDGFRVESLVE